LTLNYCFRNNSIQCPFDRQFTDTGDLGVGGLKKNFALLDLLEEQNQDVASTSSAYKDELVI